MGRVYTAEQVARHEVPEIGAHEKAGQFILHELFEPLIPGAETSGQLFSPDGNGVESAMVYGSTAYGSAGIRSDLDILIFYRPSQGLEALEAIAKVLGTATARYKVPVEQNVLPTGAIYNDREHGLDPLFAGHLIEIHDTYNGRWCRNNPTGGLQRIADQASDSYAINRLAHGYSSGRRNLFLKCMSGGGEGVHVEAFQRALELPSAIGRKVVAATMEETDDPLDMSSRDNMQRRAMSALRIHSHEWDTELFSKHDQLYRIDQEYSQVLDQALDGSMSIEKYESWLQKQYGQACQLAYHLSNAWVDILRARQQTLVPVSVGGDQLIHEIAGPLPHDDDYPNASYN